LLIIVGPTPQLRRSLDKLAIQASLLQQRNSSPSSRILRRHDQPE
jgi:hypothetical protein